MTKMAERAWRLALPGFLILLMIVLAACGGGKTPAPAGDSAATAAATTSVSIPNVNSDAPAGGTNEPAPQPGLSPTGGQSTAGGVQAFPAGEVKPVEITTADGVALTGTFYVAPKTGGPAVVMLHMVGGQRGDWDTLARQLQTAGFSVLTFDLRGHGGSQGQRDWDKMGADAAAAFAWLAGRPEVNPSQIGLVGASIGANLSLNFAATQPAVKTLALLSPGLDYQGIKTEGAMQAYGPRPVLLIASTEDKESADAVPVLDKLALGKHTLKQLEGQGHGTRMLGRQNGIEETIVDWLRETLK